MSQNEDRETKRRMDEILRRMLNTPPKPKQKPEKKKPAE